MTQDERWMAKYNEVMDYMKKNHRNPSKYNQEERNMYNFVKHTRKQLNQGILKPERVEQFLKLQELGEKYKRKNQYS